MIRRTKYPFRIATHAKGFIKIFHNIDLKPRNKLRSLLRKTRQSIQI